MSPSERRTKTVAVTRSRWIRFSSERPSTGVRRPQRIHPNLENFYQLDRFWNGTGGALEGVFAALRTDVTTNKCQYTGFNRSSISCSFVCESRTKPGSTYQVNYPPPPASRPSQRSCAEILLETDTHGMTPEEKDRVQRAIIAQGCKQ